VFWTVVLGILAGLSLICLIWQWLAAVRFPLHQQVAPNGYAPSISILKPLKGTDEHTLACLSSWTELVHPGEVEVLFGVDSLDDPACQMVEQLRRACPQRNITLAECRDQWGANAKVSKLIQLERMARHGVIVVSDADVHVPPDLLSSLIAPLADARVGMVNCFYRLANPLNLAMRWEAVGVNADFWSQVLQGRTIAPQDFGLGAVMAMRREELRSAGGFEALVNHVADDFQLGHRIARAGRRIEICPLVVECRDPVVGWKGVWLHQVRWQRTIRVCKPLPYAISIFANPLLWPVLLALVSSSRPAVALLIIALVVRGAITADLLRRFNPATRDWCWCWLASFKDAASVALWITAFAGNRIHWRGTTYRVLRDGRLTGGASVKPVH